ncbi:hypothetical protein SK128_004591 [Halocaridina rubra]|uniref:Uncharacterized protein n=1 Tax=Halocaridina rubra TaxID=373956 RepID=A0AAN8WWR4_HALRR
MHLLQISSVFATVEIGESLFACSAIEDLRFGAFLFWLLILGLVTIGDPCHKLRVLTALEGIGSARQGSLPKQSLKRSFCLLSAHHSAGLLDHAKAYANENKIRNSSAFLSLVLVENEIKL